MKCYKKACFHRNSRRDPDNETNQTICYQTSCCERIEQEPFDCDVCGRNTTGDVYQDRTGNMFVCEECFNKGSIEDQTTLQLLKQAVRAMNQTPNFIYDGDKKSYDLLAQIGKHLREGE